MTPSPSWLERSRIFPKLGPGLSYRLYRPDVAAYDEDTKKFGGEHGHLDLQLGEMALTFDKPIPLTYMKTNDQGVGEYVKMEGVLAMAITAHPSFSIRRCSTFHWTRREFEALPTDYVILWNQIRRLTFIGMDQLARQLGQVVGAGDGQTSEDEVPLTMTMPSR